MPLQPPPLLLLPLLPLPLLQKHARSTSAAPQPARQLPLSPSLLPSLTLFIRSTTYGHNRKVVREANAAGTRMDVVLYGDSISALLWIKYPEVGWLRCFFFF